MTATSTAPPAAASQDHQQHLLTLPLNLLYALAACITVANVYWNQAILNQLATAFDADSGSIGLVATVTTIGYAIGLLLIAPLGDMLGRRKVVLGLCALLTVFSTAIPFIPWLPLFKACSFFIGMLAVTPQIMIPLVADLAAPERRGKAVGLIVSGLMLGILGSRVVSGLVARYSDWKTVYYLGAGLNGAVTVVLFFLLPDIPCKNKISYPQLMHSLWKLLRDEVVLRQCAAIIFLVFASFQLFWTVLTFHLHDAFHYNSFEVGLFGLVGMAGILAAPLAGHLGDKQGPYIVVSAGLVLFTASTVIMAVWGGKLAAIVVGGFVLDLGLQMVQVSNQIRIYALLPAARSRLNSVYMVLAFLGGSMGSAVGSAVYERRGWRISLLVACAWSVVAILVLLSRTPLQRGYTPGWLRGDARWWKGLDTSKSLKPEVATVDPERTAVGPLSGGEVKAQDEVVETKV